MAYDYLGIEHILIDIRCTFLGSHGDFRRNLFHQTTMKTPRKIKENTYPFVLGNQKEAH